MHRREPNGYAYTLSGRQSDSDALRVRCRVTVLMQRACDAVHRACSPHMPLAVQLQLLSVLQVGCPCWCFIHPGQVRELLDLVTALPSFILGKARSGPMRRGMGTLIMRFYSIVNWSSSVASITLADKNGCSYCCR